jgi:hypothetical protein
MSCWGLGRKGRNAFIGIASTVLVGTGMTVSAGAPPSGAVVPSGPFTVVAKDYSFEGVPKTIAAAPANTLTNVTMQNQSTEEHHEIVFVRLKDAKENQGLSIDKAKEALIKSFNFEAQPDSANVGGFTPGFPSTTSGGIRDATMGGRADVFRDSFGGSKTHEVEFVPPNTTKSNGIDLTRPGRYLYFCPITALAQNDPSQEPHYVQPPGQIGFMEVK